MSVGKDRKKSELEYRKCPNQQLGAGISEGASYSCKTERASVEIVESVGILLEFLLNCIAIKNPYIVD